jgi:hypothetical protein
MAIRWILPKPMRWRLCIVLVLMSVALVGAYVLLERPTPARLINKDTYASIKEGMTESEVEAIFGSVAGDYSTRLPPGPRMLIQRLQQELDGLNHKLWISDGGIVVIYFNEEQRVDTAFFYQSFVRPEPTIIQRVRHWIGI